MQVVFVQFSSLKTTRGALVIGHASGFITDAEFSLLHQENSSDNEIFLTTTTGGSVCKTKVKLIGKLIFG